VWRIEPQAYRAELGAGWGTVNVHFHPVNQFQVMLTGSGMYGNHAVSVGSIHYTDPFTPYGPLTPGSEGFSFVVLRSVIDHWAYYMPECRAELAESRSTRVPSDARFRNFVVSVEESPDAPVQDGWSVLYDDDDELLIVVGDLDGEELKTPRMEMTGGFAVVLDGSVTDGASEFPVGSTMWLEPHSAGTPIAAGGHARVAVVRFPRHEVAA
jgi:hypothetical protein